MSGQTFYVGARAQNDETNITGFVPAKFLTIDGQPVVDPMPGGSQNAFVYADGQGNAKTHAAFANPNNYLIVPADFSEQQASAYAAKIADLQKLPLVGAPLALGKMAYDFHPGGPQDLQRDPQWGIPEGSFVPAFISSASHYLGYVSGLTGTPLELPEIAGGFTNGGDNTNGPHGVSRQNHFNLAKGFSDAQPWRTSRHG